MDEITAIAKKHGLKVVEDAAQAIGSEYKGRRAGSLGDVGCFSFFPSKNLGAAGDAGIVTTDDDELARKMVMLRVHGGERAYYHNVVGGNFRIDALQAAVLRVKLRELDKWTAGRQRNAADYDRRLAEAGLVPDKVVPPPVRQSRHIFNQYVPRVKDRDGLMEHLKAKKNRLRHLLPGLPAPAKVLRAPRRQARRPARQRKGRRRGHRDPDLPRTHRRPARLRHRRRRRVLQQISTTRKTKTASPRRVRGPWIDAFNG